MAEFERDYYAKAQPRQREIDAKVESGKWFDDWSSRARYAAPEDFEQRRTVNCKPRPKDSRVNRGAKTGGGTDREEKLRFVPWCERK